MGISTSNTKFFDLHIDTLFELEERKTDIFDNNLSVCTNKIPKDMVYEAFFAIYTPDEYDDFKSYQQATRLLKEYKKIDCKNIIKHLSLESARPLLYENSPELFIKNGLQLVSLTYNGDNEIACGCFTKQDVGIFEKGKTIVKSLCYNDITIDVAHSSQKTFYDLCNLTDKSIICSHTAARKMADHKRNLSDEQISIINERNGLIGVCAYPPFLCLEKTCTIDKLIDHIEYFLSQGCENSLCFGTDFDGIRYKIQGFEDIGSIFNLKNSLLKRNFSEEIIDKIFYYNAKKFFIKKRGISPA